MLEFRSITPRDREVLHPYLYDAKGHGCEYSFANLYFWGDQKVAFFDGAPVFFSVFGPWKNYLLPLGSRHLSEAVRALRADAHERGISFRLFGLTYKETEQLRELFPDQFRFYTVRDNFDYVYDIERLAQLRGKKLQAKRNHCNRFEAQYPDYEILTLTKELLPQCETFLKSWFQSHEQIHADADFEAEQSALQKAFSNFDALHMEGILLKTQDGIMGFSMGNRIREDTFDVNFEKALPEVNGAYPMVNREFARRILRTYPEVKYLNREDDMGISGLRQAKESYVPDILLEKFVGEEC